MVSPKSDRQNAEGEKRTTMPPYLVQYLRSLLPETQDDLWQWLDDNSDAAERMQKVLESEA